MSRFRIISPLVLVASTSLAGCGGLVSSLIPKIKPTVTLSSNTSGSQIDATQSVTVQAFTDNDSGAGVSWTLASGNPGTLTNATVTQVTYTSPSSIASPAQITITATSKADSSVSATLSFTVNPAPAISGSLSSGSVGTAYTATLSVSGGVGPYTWTVTGLPNGLTATPAASPSNSLTISGTPANEGASSVSINVFDSTYPSVSAPADNVTLTISPSQLAVTPAALSPLMELAFFKQPLAVAPSTTGPFTWAISSGSLPTGVSLNSTTGVLSGTPTATGAYDFTVQVSDSETPTAGTGTVTYSGSVQASTVAGKLSGQYAFLLQGFDAGGNAAALIGSFTADGKGSITAGEIDANDNFAVGRSSSSVTGNYTIDANLRGTVNFNTSVSQVSKSISIAYALSNDGTRGKLISLDANGFQMLGEMQKQDSTGFTAASVESSYAFGLQSNTQPKSSAAGQIAISSSGQITGAMDQSTSGQGTGNASLTGSMTSAPDANGRGVVLVSQSQSSWTISYYVVSSGELYLMEIDPSSNSTTILAGQARRQKLPFTGTSPNGTSVFSLSGYDANAATQGPISAIGRIIVQNSGGVQFSFDENAANGSVITTANLSGTLSSFDASTGREIIAISGGASGGLFDGGALYIYDSGAGFLVDATTGSGTRAMLAQVVPQSGTSFATPSGNLIGTYGASLSEPAAEFDAFVSIDNGQGSPTADVRSQGQPDQADDVFASATFSAPDATGRGTGNLPGTLVGLTGGGNATSVYYLVGANQFFLINTVADKPSAVGFFDPQ